MADDMSDDLRRLQAKIEQRLDQNLALVRGEYLSLDKAERQEFHKWIASLEPVVRRPGFHIYAKAVVQLLVPHGDELSEALVSVESLNRAIRAWDGGEEYVPNMGDV